MGNTVTVKELVCRVTGIAERKLRSIPRTSKSFGRIIIMNHNSGS